MYKNNSFTKKNSAISLHFYIKSPASPIFTDSSSAYTLSSVPQYNVLKPNLAVFSQTVQPDKKFCFLYQVHYLCEHLHMTICLLLLLCYL